jgi:uncharacterized protein (UPF0179 family)
MEGEHAKMMQIPYKMEGEHVHMQEISCKMEGCPNVANTMQHDKFKVQTVANTRQIVPAKKSKKKSQTCSKKILKLFHTL